MRECAGGGGGGGGFSDGEQTGDVSAAMKPPTPDGSETQP